MAPERISLMIDWVEILWPSLLKKRLGKDREALFERLDGA
jgi:hypothetical protein